MKGPDKLNSKTKSKFLTIYQGESMNELISTFSFLISNKFTIQIFLNLTSASKLVMQSNYFNIFK